VISILRLKDEFSIFCKHCDDQRRRGCNPIGCVLVFQNNLERVVVQ
jgi:hypothetical protein